MIINSEIFENIFNSGSNSKGLSSKSRKNLRKLIKKNLQSRNYFMIIKKLNKNSNNVKNDIKILSKFFGKKIKQNKKGQTILKIKNKKKLLKKNITKKNTKLRYHQTNFGGSIHSDGPQLNIPPKYVIMGCSNNAKQGGLSILTNTKKIYKHMMTKQPEYLKILKEPFIFERRGFNYSNSNTFKKPIFEKKGNTFRFRYLREYIESGYKIKKEKIFKKKIEALNYLDKILENKKFKYTYKLNKGDYVILNNNVIAHGRSSFKIEKNNPRELVRVWVR